MANIFVKIGEKVWDVLKSPFVHAQQVAAVLEKTGEDLPEAKNLIVELVARSEAVDADVFAAVGTNGLNLPADLTAIKDAQAFFVWFKGTFVPGVEKIYADVTEAVKVSSGSPASPAPAPAPAPAPSTPGHLSPA